MAGWSGTGERMISSDDIAKSQPSSAGAKISGPRRIPVETLMRDATEVILVHRGTDYRLRVTANGKLILTK
jgi:hemin uptake protein HemP